MCVSYGCVCARMFFCVVRCTYACMRMLFFVAVCVCVCVCACKGRVGDSPIPGAGLYADDEAGAAVVCACACVRVCLVFLFCLFFRGGGFVAQLRSLSLSCVCASLTN